jgi:hypothetical protein
LDRCGIPSHATVLRGFVCCVGQKVFGYAFMVRCRRRFTTGEIMSKQTRQLPAPPHQPQNWSVLSKETKAEYWASEELTDAEKRFLDRLETLPEEDWEPVACGGAMLSDLIMAERGER